MNLKWLLCGIVITAVLLTGIAEASGTAFTLVKDGRPACSIVIGADATRNARVAAQELRTYVERISGARLEIFTDADAIPAGGRVLVGRSRLTDAIPGLRIPSGITPAFREEGYVIHCTGDTLVLAGNDSKAPENQKPSQPAPHSEVVGESMYLGTRYAVYDLLNRLGVRWFMPGEYGEVAPRSATLQVPAMSVTEQPDFPVRSFFASGGDGMSMLEERELWMIRNRMNPRSGPWFGVPADSSIHNIMPKDKFEEHPEWFALQPDGTRNSGMPCMTDELRRNDPRYAGQPRLLDEILKKIGQNIANGHRSTDFSPDDGTPTCECNTCWQMSLRFTDEVASDGRTGEEGDPGSAVPVFLTSQEYFFFVNGLLEAVGQKYPGHVITTNGYANRYFPPEPPADFNRHKNLTIMFADITACTIHRYDDPKCWQNRQQYNLLKRWCDLSDKVWVYNYNYTMLVSKGTLTPMTRRIRANIPMVKKTGSVGFHDQDWVDLSQLGLPTYVARAALLWNAGVDVDAVLDDFYQKWFGPAAAAMREYYSTLETAFDSASCHGHEDVILATIYTPKVMDRLARAMAHAEAAAGTDTEKLHVRSERLLFDHLRTYVESLQAKQELRFADAAVLMERMLGLKAEMRKISQFYGWDAAPYGMEWEARRMKRLAELVDGTEGRLLSPMPPTARFRADKYDIGRSERWMDQNYNDAKWQLCSTCNGWQNQGLKDDDGLTLMSREGHAYRGVGWYRFTVDSPAVAEDEQAFLFAPAVVNQAWVWVNGQYAGRTNYRQAWFRPQELDMDITEHLKPGKNVIALRVVCNEAFYGSNGIYERPFLYAKKR